MISNLVHMFFVLRSIAILRDSAVFVDAPHILNPVDITDVFSPEKIADPFGASENENDPSLTPAVGGTKPMRREPITAGWRLLYLVFGTSWPGTILS